MEMESVEEYCSVCNCVIDKSYVENEVDEVDKLIKECNTKRVDPVAKENVPINTQTDVIRWLLNNAANKPIQNTEEIIKACENIDTEEILELLRVNDIIIINDESSFPNTGENEKHALVFAIEHDNVDIISWLHENGTQINGLFCHGNYVTSAIHIATLIGNVNSLMKLINLGATITGDLLENAVDAGHLHMVRFICKNPHIMSFMNFADAIKTAIYNNSYEIVECIIEHYVNSNHFDHNHDLNCIVPTVAIKGKIELLKWALNFGCLDLHGVHEDDGISALHVASELGNLNLIKWLLNSGSDINSRDNNGLTPLHFAARCKHSDCVEYLVHMGADTNAKTVDGKSVLHLAVESGDLSIVQFLVAHGSDKFALDNLGNSILHVGHISIPMVKWLVENGCDMNRKNEHGYSLLTMCANITNHETAEWLIQNGGNVKDVFVDAYFWVSVSSDLRDWTFLKMLMKYVTNINEPFHGTTLLQLAAPYTDALNLVLQHNPDVNVLMSRSILHDSLTNPKLAKMLISNGANLNARDKYGYTPLHRACLTGTKFTIVKMLVEKGADVNAVTTDEKTPVLHFASEHGDLQVVQYLVSQGADVNALCSENKSVLFRASLIGHWDVVLYLISKGADVNHHGSNFVNTVLCYAIRSKIKIYDIVELLLKNGADSNLCSKYYGEPPLSFINPTDINYAVSLFKLLIAHGADVNATGKCGEPILSRYVQYYDIVDVLLHAGADVNAENVDAGTALHKALEYKGEEYINNKINYGTDRETFRVVSRLLKGGANLNLQDIFGETALLNAVKTPEYHDIAKLLVKNGAHIDLSDEGLDSVLHVLQPCDLTVWLIDNGADVNIKNNSGQTPLHASLSWEVPVEINSIVGDITHRETSSKLSNTQQESLLKRITYSRHLNALQYLMEHVENINESDYLGKIALHYTLDNKSFNEFKLLIQCGAKIDLIDKEGNSILHLATKIADQTTEFFDYLFEKNLHRDLIKSVNNNGESVLHMAILSTDRIDVVKKLLDENIDIDCKTIDEENTALHLAVKLGKFECLKMLVHHGVDIFEPNKNGELPIQLAAQYNQSEILLFFLYIDMKLGINTKIKLYDVKNNNNENLLHIVAKHGKYETSNGMVGTLLDLKYYPIDTIDKFGNTALHNACMTHVINNVKLLVQKGGYVNSPNHCGYTPLHFAAKVGSVSIVSYLLENGGDVKMKNKRGNTPLHIAVAHGKIEASKCLIEHGADIYAKNNKGFNILHLAALSKYQMLLEILKLYSKDKINDVSNKKSTPLLLALKRPTLITNLVVLIKVQDLSVKDVFGKTALHIASEYQSTYIIFQLVRRSNVYAVDKEGNTPLHIAVISCRKDAVETLLPFHHNLSVQNNSGFNVLQEACIGINVLIVETLLKFCEPGVKCASRSNNLLQLAIANDVSDEILKYLVTKYCYLLSYVNNEGATVLHTCIEMPFQGLDMFEFLISHGANMNARDNKGNTCLHIAATFERLDIIKYLVVKGMDVNSVNNEKNTPLQFAAVHGHFKIVQFLCENNADVNAVDINNITPLQISIRFNQITIGRYLVEEMSARTDIIDITGKNALQLVLKFVKDPEMVLEWKEILGS